MVPSVAFHDLQQGGGTRDLPYYRELARRSGSTLELGAGTGRVALELAGLTDLAANDVDEQLMEELVRRAHARGVTVTPVLGDATKLDLGRRFDLILAPAGFAQTVGGPGTRQALLRVIKRHLAVTGLAVVAITDVEEVLRECTTPAPSRRLRARGRTFVCQQLPATEIEGGARVTWKRVVRRRIAGRPASRSSGTRRADLPPCERRADRHRSPRLRPAGAPRSSRPRRRGQPGVDLLRTAPCAAFRRLNRPSGYSAPAGITYRRGVSPPSALGRSRSACSPPPRASDGQLGLPPVRRDPRQDRAGARARGEDRSTLDDHASRWMRPGQPPDECLLGIFHRVRNCQIVGHADLPWTPQPKSGAR